MAMAMIPEAAKATEGVASRIAPAARNAGKTITARRGIGVKRPSGAQSYGPEMAAVATIAAIDFGSVWLLDRGTLPSKGKMVALAVIGLSLGILADISQRLGRNMSYLIIGGELMARGVPLIRAITGLEPRPQEPKHKSTPRPPSTVAKINLHTT
jgi:hypothetical protein